MTYRARLFALLSILVVFTNGILAADNYFTCARLLRNEVHRKAHSIAVTTATFLDPALVAAVYARGDEAKPRALTQVKAALPAHSGCAVSFGPAHGKDLAHHRVVLVTQPRDRSEAAHVDNPVANDLFADVHTHHLAEDRVIGRAG